MALTSGHGSVEEREPRVDAQETAALLAIARLDLEAAAAYEVVAQTVTGALLRRMLLSFADDHRRHVQDIHVICRARGTVVEVPPPPEPCTSSFVSLGSTFATLDPEAAIENMIGNEELQRRHFGPSLLGLLGHVLRPLTERRDSHRRVRSRASARRIVRASCERCGRPTAVGALS